MSTTAPQQIIQLVHQFEQDRAAYRSPVYNEAHVRSEFIDPFFAALGLVTASWAMSGSSANRPLTVSI